MKAYIILSLIPFLISCYGPYTLRDIQSHKVEFFTGCENFEIINNKILLHSEIDSIASLVHLDMGNSTQIIRISNSSGNQKTYRKISLLPTGRDTLYYSKFSPSISNRLFDVRHSFGIEVAGKNLFTVCDSNSSAHMVIGLPLIINNSNNNIAGLSFSNSTICFTPHLPTDMSEYIELDYSIKKHQLFIDLTLNGHRDKYLFDTGNDGFILLNNMSDTSRLFPKPEIELQGLLFNTVKGSVTSTANIYYDQYFEELSSIDRSNVIVESSHISQKNLGLEFIKKFDWLFDNKNKKYI